MSNCKENKIILTVSQQNVLESIKRFVINKDERVFILKGYAGTGKTTLMKFLISYLKENKQCFHLLASTGRAAKVLSNISEGNAHTIHSMIYSFSGLNKDLSDVESPKVDKTGELFINFEASKIDEDKDPESIYIIDESSMISDVEDKIVTQAKFGTGRLLAELLNYDARPKSKFIFVGDPCQLPPIHEYFSPALSKEYFKEVFGVNAEEAQLTEIMRMSKDNDIITASKYIRSLYSKAPDDVSVYGRQKVWGMFYFRSCKDILLHSSEEEMIADYVKKIKKDGYDKALCICRSNKKCSEVSNRIREQLGLASQTIQKGDLLMVIQNNSITGLMNGDTVVVDKISDDVEKKAELTFRKISVKEMFSQKVYSILIIEDLLYQTRLNLDGDQQDRLFLDFIMRMKRKGIKQKDQSRFKDAMMKDPYLNALRCVYGYAVTCHKAQGGEWNDVYVLVPGNITLNPTKESYQWIYTAMTRAKSYLHMKDAFYIK